MNTTKIQERLNPMPAAMADKGLRRPEADLRIRANEQPQGWLRYYEKPTSIYADGSAYFKGDTPSEILDQMDEWITTLPSVEDARMAEFTAQLAAVIELGHQNGIDVQFVNPLIEAMKRLSENAIEDHSNA